MYSWYPSCCLSGRQRLMPHGFSFFFRLAFQDISGWVFHARKVHQKKGFILSSISALRLLPHVHVWRQETHSVCFTTPNHHRRDSHVLFLSLRYLIPHVYCVLQFIWHRSPRSGHHLYATWWHLKTENSMNEIRKKSCPHMHIVFSSLQAYISEEEACIGLNWRSASGTAVVKFGDKHTFI